VGKLAILDGDSFIWRCAASVEETVYADKHDKEVTEYGMAGRTDIPGLHKEVKVGTYAAAVLNLRNCIKRSVAYAGADDFVLVLSSPDNPSFRYDIAKIRPYKGNRVGKRKPAHLDALRNVCLRDFGGETTRGGDEADDYLSWCTRELSEEKDEFVIIGNDKDLNQIPGHHFDWVNEEAYHLTDEECRLFLWMQVLVGDTSDNIVGCWQMGYAKAEQFMQKWGEMPDDELWDQIVDAFRKSKKKKGCPYVKMDAEDAALETMRLVRLRQTEGEELWTPPKKILRITQENNGRKEEPENTELPSAESAEDEETQDTGGLVSLAAVWGT
jgi:hypothetical protein